MMKEFRTEYTHTLKEKIRECAEDLKLETIIVGVETGVQDGTFIVVEGEDAEIDVIIGMVNAWTGRAKIVCVDVYEPTGGVVAWYSTGNAKNYWLPNIPKTVRDYMNKANSIYTIKDSWGDSFKVYQYFTEA